MKEVFKIVRGNPYPINVYVEKMGYEGDKLKAHAVDVRTIEDLKVYAVGGGRYYQLDAKVASGGEYVTVAIPTNCCIRLGRYGIRLTGKLDGRRIVSAERRVFTLVKWNGRDYVPPKIVDGEGSYYINLKFAPGDSDVTPSSKVSGWIGFATFNDVSEIDLSSLQQVDDLCMSRTLHNSAKGARFVAVAADTVSLSFVFAGLEALLDSSDYNGHRYYYTDSLIEGDFEIDIS